MEEFLFNLLDKIFSQIIFQTFTKKIDFKKLYK
jgi:hypothetical protein